VRVSAALRVAAARGRHARTYGAGATPAAVRAQVSRSLTLRMSRPVRRAVLAALRAHRRVSLSLTLTATDALGRHVQATGSVRRLHAGRIG
jgi:hypothetical protein